MKIFNILLICFVAIISTFGISCSDREINAEQLQQRDDLYYAINEEKPYSGKVVELYESGQKRNERAYRNGKSHGLSTTWHSNGQKKSELRYKDGQLSGSYLTWYDNGQPEEEGLFKNGKRHDQWISWYPNGQNETECNYKDGKLNGRWVSWYDNGKPEKEGTYRDGKEDGQWVYRYANGQKAREGLYKNGEQEGTGDFWTRDGRKFGIVEDIDGNTYRTIKIGDQWWMVENLKVMHYSNGDSIPNVTEETAWGNLRTGAWCFYANDTDNATYGRLYNWYAVNNSRGLAPQGWHVPTDAEWQTLVDYLGGASVASAKIKESGTTHWNSPDTSASNQNGFSRLLGGARHYSGYYKYMNDIAFFWSSSEKISDVWYLYSDKSDSKVSHAKEG